MIPSPWQFVLLALAVYRLWRFCAEDDMPWLTAARNRIVGAQEVAGVWSFKRATLAHMISCPFCLGAHISLGIYLLWIWQPHWLLVLATPFALSATAALVAKNLDA